MSFSSTVKDELCRVVPEARHCLLAETAAMVSLSGSIEKFPETGKRLCISNEHSEVAGKCFTLLGKTFNINPEITIRRAVFLHKNQPHRIAVDGNEEVDRVLEGIKVTCSETGDQDSLSLPDSMVTSSSCCRRSFIRGAFLVSGSVSDPEKGYHLEMVVSQEKTAAYLQEMLVSLGLPAKRIPRKKNFVVYLKESDKISELLALMGAPLALMEWENIRVVKSVRNGINRRVNCEAANIVKTVSAAVKQVEDIAYLEEAGELDSLPDNLLEIARLRLRFPEATLKELGEKLVPPVGKSGVNHRLRKISEIASNCRSV